MGQRLIDAERLKRHYAWWGQKASAEIFKEFKHTFDIIVDLQPTVATPEIVRCKDCVNYNGGYCHHPNNYGNSFFVRDDGFCSYGCRAEDDDAEHT